MKVISVINRKGGVGKTATAHALGAGLMQKGFKVLYLDLDGQCNLTYVICEAARTLSAMDILNETATIEETIIKSDKGDIIPAAPILSGADLMITGNRKEYRIKKALEQIKDIYDYAIIDTPPALGTITTNALVASDKVIIPAQPDILSLQGIGLLHQTIEAVRKQANPDLVIDGILLTRFNERAIISRQMRDNLQEFANAIKTKLYNKPIRECTAIKEAQAMKTDIFSYAPKSNAAADYTALVDEILQTTKPTSAKKGGKNDKAKL